MTYYDYETSREAANLDNIGWRNAPFGKKVILCASEWLLEEPDIYYKYCFGKFCHYEWELWTARMLWTASVCAIESKKLEADITPLFTCDLLCYDRVGVDPRKDIRENVMRAEVFRERLMSDVFDVVEETNEELRVKLK